MIEQGPRDASQSSDVIPALLAVIYCLHDLLVASGALKSGDVAGHLMRIEGVSEATRVHLLGVAETLLAEPFNPKRRELSLVVDNDRFDQTD